MFRVTVLCFISVIELWTGWTCWVS